MCKVWHGHIYILHYLGVQLQSHGVSLYVSTGETARLFHIPPAHAPPRIYLFKILVMLVGDVVLHCKMGGGS